MLSEEWIIESLWYFKQFKEASGIWNLLCAYKACRYFLIELFFILFWFVKHFTFTSVYIVKILWEDSTDLDNYTILPWHLNQIALTLYSFILTFLLISLGILILPKDTALTVALTLSFWALTRITPFMIALMMMTTLTLTFEAPKGLHYLLTLTFSLFRNLTFHTTDYGTYSGSTDLDILRIIIYNTADEAH